VQLNLLYVQLRDAIVNGSLPCTRDESIHLAALQCQIVYGNHDKRRQKSGFLDLHKFLPDQYTKQKGIEKLIFDSHHKLFNTTESNAKLKYIQFCRSLRTYGVTFFQVKVQYYYNRGVTCMVMTLNV
jgi:talin